MKLKIKELNPNPFKKEINKGKLNKEIVDKIKANIKELGLMGSLPVFKKDNKYYLVAGHHRIEALKQVYGSNYDVEVVVHNYSEENVLRGMIVENLTQRADELMEVTDNLAVIRKYLQENNKCSPGEHLLPRKVGHPAIQEAGSVRNIYAWLNKNGEVMSVGKISEYIKVYDNLDKRLLKKAEKSEGGVIEEETISVKEAVNLARLDKKEQFEIKRLLDKTELNKDGKSKLISQYLEADEILKEEIKKGKVDIKDIGIEQFKRDIQKKVEEEELKKKDRTGIMVISGKKVMQGIRYESISANTHINKFCAVIEKINKEGYINNLEWKDIATILDISVKAGRHYSETAEKIMKVI